MSRKVDNDPTPRIAARLREERRRRAWSLDELARRAGVSKAMLSKLERGASSPTAALLGRICGAYGLTMSALVALPGEGGEENGGRLVRRVEQPVWRDPQTHYVRRQVSPLSDLPLQLVEVELPPGREVAFPASAYAFIRQLVWVLAGRLEFVEGATTHRLAAGDCLELGVPADCVFRNRGRSVCRYLVALAPRAHPWGHAHPWGQVLPSPERVGRASARGQVLRVASGGRRVSAREARGTTRQKGKT